MNRLYLLTLEIEPLEVGKAYDELPSHLTLMSRFLSNLAPEQLSSVVEPLFADTKPVNLVFGNTIQLGPKKVTAHMVSSPEEGVLHDRLRALLDKAGATFRYPQFIGSNHKAHVTQRDGKNFPPKTRLLSSAVYLIEVVDGQRLIRSRFNLDTTQIWYDKTMNTDSTAKTILCYGDSNTWGQTPDKTGRRRPSNIRWTGVLQKNLGAGYGIVEEGLSSRTTDLDYAKKPGRNGRTYLEPCLDSHAPLDIVILMLGTNDFKIEFNRSTAEIAEAVRELVELIQEKTAKYDGDPAKIVLVSPILIDGNAPRIKEWYTAHYDENSVKKSQELANFLQKVAEDTDCHFVDAAQVAKAGEDGIHLDEASHPALGDFLARHIRKLA
jgi:lysophospholipase L1-like esterase